MKPWRKESWWWAGMLKQAYLEKKRPVMCLSGTWPMITPFMLEGWAVVSCVFFSKSCKSCLSHTEICRTFTNPHVYTEQGMDEKSRERGGCISSFINHHIPLLLTKIQEHNRLRLMWQNFSGKRFHIFRNERKWSLSWLSGAISWCIWKVSWKRHENIEIWHGMVLELVWQLAGSWRKCGTSVAVGTK